LRFDRAPRRPVGPEAGWLTRAPGMHNWMMAEPSRSDLAAILSKKFDAVRKRGIERLDFRSHNQSPIQAPELEKLAARYTASRRNPARDRIQQIKDLFRDAVSDLGAENEDAQLVSALFFGDSKGR